MSRAWEQAVVRDWSALTPAEQFRYAGNTDPWVGPVDPQAAKRMQDTLHAQARTWPARREQDVCGCWRSDCGECGPRWAGGERPAPGGQAAHGVRADALLQRAQSRVAS